MPIKFTGISVSVIKLAMGTVWVARLTEKLKLGHLSKAHCPEKMHENT